MDIDALENLIKSNDEWRKYLIIKVDRVEEELIKQGMLIAELKVKAGLWGALGGVIPIMIGTLVWLIKKNL